MVDIDEAIEDLNMLAKYGQFRYDLGHWRTLWSDSVGGYSAAEASGGRDETFQHVRKFTAEQLGLPLTYIAGQAKNEAALVGVLTNHFGELDTRQFESPVLAHVVREEVQITLYFPADSTYAKLVEAARALETSTNLHPSFAVAEEQEGEFLTLVLEYKDDEDDDEEGDGDEEGGGDEGADEDVDGADEDVDGDEDEDDGEDDGDGEDE